MGDDVEAFGDDEAFVVPVDAESGVVFCASVDPSLLGEPLQVSRSLVNRFLEVANYGLTASAAQRLTDGSLVRLAPETMKQLDDGLKFVHDGGYALGMMRAPGSLKIAAQARFITGAGNPIAASMLLQTMMVQCQLRSIEQALDTIDRKIDTLGKAHRIGVLAEILALSTPIDEMRAKVAAGASLTSEDENRLRDLEHEARRLGHQSRLWLEHLQSLRSDGRIRLSVQHEMLTRALGDEHVAFWVKAAIASDTALVQILALRGHRAAMAEESAWAGALNEKIRREIDELGTQLFTLHADIDAYLRNGDIARGLEELSLLRKRDVRRRRRQLMEVSNNLRDGLLAAAPLFRDGVGVPVPQLAGALDRRAVEPRVVRDTLVEGASAAGRVLGDGASAAGRALGDGTNAAGRVVSDSAEAVRSAAVRAGRETRRRLQR